MVTVYKNNLFFSSKKNNFLHHKSNNFWNHLSSVRKASGLEMNESDFFWTASAREGVDGRLHKYVNNTHKSDLSFNLWMPKYSLPEHYGYDLWCSEYQQLKQNSGKRQISGFQYQLMRRSRDMSDIESLIWWCYIFKTPQDTKRTGEWGDGKAMLLDICWLMLTALEVLAAPLYFLE